MLEDEVMLLLWLQSGELLVAIQNVTKDEKTMR